MSGRKKRKSDFDVFDATTGRRVMNPLNKNKLDAGELDEILLEEA